MSTYKTWYGVNGIFFDEMGGLAADKSYYAALGAYATSLGYTLTVGNPGDPVPATFVGATFGIFNVYESQGVPSISTLKTDALAMNKDNFAMMAYGTPLVNSTYLESASAYVSYIYLTSDVMPSPYDALPSYFTSLVSQLSGLSTQASTTSSTPRLPRLSATSTTSTSTTSTQTSIVTVQSANANGQPLTGAFTIVMSGGVPIVAGFTPLSFTGDYGHQYSVRVFNFGDHFFSHWSNGSSSGPTTTITPDTATTTLTAYYASTSQEALTVQSVTTSGSSEPGM